jgi:BirA family transcriptional regulator, biotin operon repressor / biotin---[acetyl-CoA-carboxylase] ligase
MRDEEPGLGAFHGVRWRSHHKIIVSEGGIPGGIISVMDPDRLRHPLHVPSLREEVAGLPWRRIEVIDETGSTNADLLARAAAGEDIDGLVLIAEHQTAGRGRSGRSWSAAPRAQIALSAGVSAAGVPIDTWGWLPLAVGVAVNDTVAAQTGVEAGLKWPNDVLAGGGKLAGILAEVAAPRPLIVVGVGLNVTLRADEVDDPMAISLADLGVAAPDRQQLASRLLFELGRRIAQWRAADQQLAADYRARSLTIGAGVRAILPGDREVVGVARSVDDQGRLCIESEGRIVEVSAGDVVHIRPVHRPRP